MGIAQRRVAPHRTIPSDVTGSKGGFAAQYQRLREHVNALLVFPVPVPLLPEYCNTQGVPIKEAPGRAGTDRTTWHPAFRHFYESEVQPELDKINQENQRSAKAAHDAHQDAVSAQAAGSDLAGISLLELDIALSCPESPEKLAKYSYHAQLETMKHAMKELRVFDKLLLLSELLRDEIDSTKSTKHKVLYDALHELVTERQEAGPSEEHLAWVENCFASTSASAGVTPTSALASTSASASNVFAASASNVGMASASNVDTGLKRQRLEAPNGHGGGDGGTVHRSLGALPAPVNAASLSTGEEEEETEAYRSLGAESTQTPAYRSLGAESSPTPQYGGGLGAPSALEVDAPAAATLQPSQSLGSLTLRQRFARLMLTRLHQALEPGSTGN